MSSAEPSIIPVEWADPRAVAIREEFDAEMDERYDTGQAPPPEVAAMLAEVFGMDLDDLAASLLLLEADGTPAGFGALFRRPEDGTLEPRKVAVRPAHRRRGHARRLLGALEERARELGAKRLILDTGPKQPDAVALYEALGYRRIPPFPPYDRLGEDGAICFEVDLRRGASAG